MSKKGKAKSPAKRRAASVMVKGPAVFASRKSTPVVLPPTRRVGIEVLLPTEEGLSVISSEEGINSSNVARFRSTKIQQDRAARALSSLGFKITMIGPHSLSIEGTPALFTKTFGTQLQVATAGRFKCGAPVLDQEYYAPAPQSTWEIPSELKDVIVSAHLQPPATYFESALPPNVNYFHLKVPSDVAMLTNASLVHQRGITGRGIKVAMVDSGFFNHKYYQSRGLNPSVMLGPGAVRPLKDDVGHGTAHAANVFATAPGVTLTVIKTGASEASAFKTAVDLKPDIITCSWGFDLVVPAAPNRRHLTSIPGMHKSLELDVARAVAEGICVVFASGNGEVAFPGMHPDVISVGGIFVEPGGGLTASNFSSAFDSKPYLGRHVPDVCGLVGMQPRGVYIMLPVQPSCVLDRELSAGSFPVGDETLLTDGWSVISGTSAAAPQIAGICALLKQKNPSLTPREIRQALIATAIDCTRGEARSESNEGVALKATVGADGATGHGLVNAAAAVEIV